MNYVVNVSQKAPFFGFLLFISLPKCFGQF